LLLPVGLRLETYRIENSTANPVARIRMIVGANVSVFQVAEML
jgi:hypothetical protein